ncbi:hypothetical protein [Aurantiacibacter suaedae]|uniref:hypothetical protein n=1 Tax=Aurantiacibacter suaedae TaxID=2545755 RepID=UPI001386C2F2|nr:hypothetical protein [Aurantiacibacter suaedae]
MSSYATIPGVGPVGKPGELALPAIAQLFFVNAKLHSTGHNVREHVGMLIRREVSL